MSSFSGPILLDQSHEVEDFDCGKAPLNEFLTRYALANQSNGSARTFVVLDGSQVAGYYSLSASSVIASEAPARMSAGMARHPIPAILMARFAVDLRFQGLGLGKALFKDALKRSLFVSKDVGVRAFIVHAKDDGARALYRRLEMNEFEQNPFHLYYLMKDIQRALRDE